MNRVLIQASWLSYSVTLGKPLASLSLSFLLHQVVVRLNKKQLLSWRHLPYKCSVNICNCYNWPLVVYWERSLWRWPLEFWIQEPVQLLHLFKLCVSMNPCIFHGPGLGTGGCLKNELLPFSLTFSASGFWWCLLSVHRVIFYENHLWSGLAFTFMFKMGLFPCFQLILFLFLNILNSWPFPLYFLSSWWMGSRASMTSCKAGGN